MLTDDYSLALLPLARLLGEQENTGLCLASARFDRAYRGVLQTGVLGYQLYTYYGLVQTRYGQEVERNVRDYHIGMFSHVDELASMLEMIDGAVRIGAVITSTALNEVTTPVEMNVALALLLGLPESPHYVTDPGQRLAQITLMVPEIDWCFADCLVRARKGMIEVFSALTGMLDSTGMCVTDKATSMKLCPQA